MDEILTNPQLDFLYPIGTGYHWTNPHQPTLADTCDYEVMSTHTFKSYPDHGEFEHIA